MRLLIPTLLLLALLTSSAEAQITIMPPELYSSSNVITVRAPNGIREISVVNTRNISVTGAGPVTGCPRTATITAFVATADQDARLAVTVIDCQGRSQRRVIEMRQPLWSLDQVNMGTVEEGSTRCATFHISTGGSVDYVDSITVADPRVTLRLPTRTPTRLRPEQLYEYTVCFVADKPGVYRFPVTTWMRRAYPSGGYTTYPVSDTGMIRVVRKPEVIAPRDTVRREPERIPERVPARREPVIEEPVTDPTTFRSVAVPNAIIPKAGSIVLGSYDFLGLIAAYVPIDNVMILAGGALPTPDDWTGVRGDMFGAYSIGLKVGLPIGERLNIAAGYQWARSIFDQAITVDTLESQITLSAPYAAISFGDDNSRISATFGYAFKHHVIPTGEFDVDAAIVAIGGDRRIGNNWKVAGEVAYMETLGVLPIVGSFRYFTNSYALDLGVAFVGITLDDGAPPKIPLLPVISGVFVF